jgi:hypothetical protein
MLNYPLLTCTASPAKYLSEVCEMHIEGKPKNLDKDFDGIKRVSESCARCHGRHTSDGVGCKHLVLPQLVHLKY